jgi:hypothetical protein
MEPRTRRTAVAVASGGAAVAAAVAVRYAPAVLAVPAGLLLAFVLPGVALGALLRDRLSAAERLVLPAALSLATIVLGGLLLDVAGLRLTRTTWTALLVAVTVLATAFGYLRGRGAGFGGTRRSWPGTAAVTRVAAPLALGVAVLAVATWVSFDSARTQAPAAVTALSVVPAGDTADHRTVVVGLTSGERAATDFTVRVDGADDFESTVDVALEHAGSWRRTLTIPSGDVTVELYRAGESEPYRSAFLEEAS